MSFLSNMLGRRSMDSESGSPTSPVSPKSPSASSAIEDNVWRSTFNPGRNYNQPRGSKDMIDHVPTGTKTPSVWDHVIKSANLQRMSFSQLDKDGDGYLSAEDLRTHFGPAANVSQLIDAADKDKDGRISLSEFRVLMQSR